MPDFVWWVPDFCLILPDFKLAEIKIPELQWQSLNKQGTYVQTPLKTGSKNEAIPAHTNAQIHPIPGVKAFPQCRSPYKSPYQAKWSYFYHTNAQIYPILGVKAFL
jgi:hypothetical protein